MKKMYLKYKILVNGFNPSITFSRDGFILKEGIMNESKFIEGNEDNQFDMNLNINSYLISCLTDHRRLSYNFFESDDWVEIDVSNKITKKNFASLIVKNERILGRVFDFEEKLRLGLNIPVLFQLISIGFYDENKNYIGMYQLNRPISSWNRLTYGISNEEISNNSRFKFDLNAIKKTNKRFHRALEFYNESFNSEKIAIRFILAFTSLEALFNIDTKEIIEKLSRYSAKLLAEGKAEDYKIICDDIKRLYDKRSRYIHGDKNTITTEDELLLRSYVRKIIIAYWMIYLFTQKSSDNILRYLDSDEKMDIRVRIAISTINAKSFDEQQIKAIKLIEEELGNTIPIKIKKSLLSNCARKDKEE